MQTPQTQDSTITVSKRDAEERAFEAEMFGMNGRYSIHTPLTAGVHDEKEGLSRMELRSVHSIVVNSKYPWSIPESGHLLRRQ